MRPDRLPRVPTAVATRRLGPAALLVLAIAAGCGGSGGGGGAAEEAEEALRAEVAAALEEYLPVLGESYTTGNLEPLRPFAVERVLAQVEKRLSDTLDRGIVIEPTFRGLIIEELTPSAYDIVLVTTLETWDLRYLSAGSRVVVEERPGNRSRVAYQLKKEGGSWRIFSRELRQDLS